MSNPAGQRRAAAFLVLGHVGPVRCARAASDAGSGMGSGRVLRASATSGDARLQLLEPVVGSKPHERRLGTKPGIRR